VSDQLSAISFQLSAISFQLSAISFPVTDPQPGTWPHAPGVLV
jgi:hypothetical protein